MYYLYKNLYFVNGTMRFFKVCNIFVLTPQVLVLLLYFKSSLATVVI
jgi:hypothetical protein